MGSRVSLYRVTRIKDGLANGWVMSRQIWTCVYHKHIQGSGGIILLIRNVSSRWDEWWHSSPGLFTQGRGDIPYIQSNGAASELVWLLQRSDKYLATAENLTKIPQLHSQSLQRLGTQVPNTSGRFGKFIQTAIRKPQANLRFLVDEKSCSPSTFLFLLIQLEASNP